MNDRPTRVLIAGAGVAAFEAALALRALASAHVSVELLAPERDFVYRPLAVAAPFRVGEVRQFPLDGLVHSAGAALRHGAVQAVDAIRKVVTTREGEEVSYDALLLTLGTRPIEEITGALTFRGPQDEGEVERLLEQARSGWVKKIVFAMPRAAAWPLPLYELALLTQAHLSNRGAEEVAIEIVTPESAPLELFGVGASEAIRELLDIRGIGVTLGTIPMEVADGFLHMASGAPVRADRVVALPRLEGPFVEGIPQNGQGFVNVDAHGVVPGLDEVWAAGDMTDFPVKQGGLAAQQAEAAAQSIAAFAGSAVEPQPFAPVLRGLLLTGLLPRFIRGASKDEKPSFDTEPLWWPPAKIVGRYLAPFLARQVGLSPNEPPLTGTPGVPIEVSLSPPSLAPQ
jgi:sulfide:quinone oxidoreductase